MSAEQPKSTATIRPIAPLTDLPAQPVNETEAEGVKGGTTSDVGSAQLGMTQSA